MAVEGALLGFGAGSFFILEGLIEALGEEFHCFDKGDVLEFLNELKDVAGKSCAEAFEDAPLGQDVEGGRFFVLERAETDPVAPGSFKLNFASHDIINVDVQL